MSHIRRTWPAALLLASSLGVAVRAIAADLQTLQLATGQAVEARRYLAADALMAAASLLALAAWVTRRSWTPWATVGWMVTTLAVIGWVLFVAIGAAGPPFWLRAGIWLACAGVSTYAVHVVRRQWRTDHALEAGGARPL